jgi:nucleoside-diphosphate-sugar epimerase
MKCLVTGGAGFIGSNKAKKELGWFPKVQLETWLKENS